MVTQTVSGIPIEYINEDALTDKGLMLEETENSGTSTTVDITFKGRRRHIVQLDRSKVRVTADLLRHHRRRGADGYRHPLLYGSAIQPVQYHH